MQLGMISSTFPEVGNHRTGDVLSNGVEHNEDLDRLAVHQGGEDYTAQPDMILPDEDIDPTLMEHVLTQNESHHHQATRQICPSAS